jgi:signal peptide peptidase SppA
MFFGGGASVEGLIQTLRTVAADPSIGTVLLDIDSPGGTVSGMPELAAEVRKLAESKHVVAMANSLAASAAYWIASQADEVVAAPEAMAGSIGVFAVHEDWSKLLDEMGIKVTYIHAGKYKVEGNPDEPLSDEARAHMQSMVDDSYDLFIGDVAAGRGVSKAVVKSDYGEGRVLTPSAAKAAGMIDRIASFSDTVNRLATKTPGGNSLALKSRRLDMSEKT